MRRMLIAYFIWIERQYVGQLEIAMIKKKLIITFRDTSRCFFKIMLRFCYKIGVLNINMSTSQCEYDN